VKNIEEKLKDIKLHIEGWVERSVDIPQCVYFTFDPTLDKSRKYYFYLQRSNITTNIIVESMYTESHPTALYQDYETLNKIYISEMNTTVPELTDKIFEHICIVLTKERMLGYL